MTLKIPKLFRLLSQQYQQTNRWQAKYWVNLHTSENIPNKDEGKAGAKETENQDKNPVLP